MARIPKDMKLTQVVQQLLDKNEWKNELELDEEQRQSRLKTTGSIEGQSYSIFIDADENNELFHVFFYTPFVVNSKRIPEMARLLNLLNWGLKVGRLSIYDDDDSNPIQWKAGYDIEGGSLSVEQIESLLSWGIDTFQHRAETLASVALTKISAKDAYQQFLEKLKKLQESNSDSDAEDQSSSGEVPDKL